MKLSKITRELFFVCVALPLLVSFASKASAEKPNIILIMVDDLGKEWVGSYGAEGIKTPNIDQLAAGGLQFNNVYCMPQCTPTRLTLLTGQYPFRHGWVNHWDVPRWGGGCSYDPNKNPAIGKLIRNAGYKTACAGKWQIDDFRQEPDAMKAAGFDRWCMWTGYEAKNPPSGKRYWDAYLYTNDGSKTYKDEFGPDKFTEFMVDFIRESKDDPFFLYFPMALTHGPLVPTPDDPDAKETMEKHRAMVRYTDAILGKIVAELEKQKIRDNTIIIWTTDNGTSRGIRGSIDGKEIRGGKAQVTENGICVPFIVNCPKLVPRGKKTDALADFTDLLPTLVEIAGGKVTDKHAIDGKSFADVVLGKSVDSKRDWIMSMGGRNEARLSDRGVENKYWFRDRVLRDKRFKLYVGTNRKPEKLFDLQKDPFEANNLIESQDKMHRDAINKLFAPIAKMPTRDNDPVYEPLPHKDWYRVPKVKSQTWKTGYPGKAPKN